MTDWILTFGSVRQSRELAATAAAFDFEVLHVDEDDGGVARDIHDMTRDTRARLLSRDDPPAATVNLGRATVTGGIERVAKVQASLRQRLPEMEVVGPSPRAATVWGDKWLIARAMAELGVDTPKTWSVSDTGVAELVDAMRAGALRCPAVLKARTLTGGCGMLLVEHPDDLAPAVDKLEGAGHQLVLMEFVLGDEISVDVLRLGSRTLVYPPGIKRTTDPALTHADHKVKVNGLVDTPPALAEDVVRIAERFDLNGFFSLEAVVTSTGPARWHVLEGATRVTNNVQMQDVSVGHDAFAMVCRHLRGQEWFPSTRTRRLALSIPSYDHTCTTHQPIVELPWVRQVKEENLAEMPMSRDERTRLTVKLDASVDLDGRLATLERLTGDDGLGARARAEVDRVRAVYGAPEWMRR